MNKVILCFLLIGLLFTNCSNNDDDDGIVKNSELDGLWQPIGQSELFIEFDGSKCFYWYSGYSSDKKSLKLGDSFTVKLYEKYMINGDGAKIKYAVHYGNTLEMQWDNENGGIEQEVCSKVDKGLYSFDYEPIKQ